MSEEPKKEEITTIKDDSSAKLKEYEVKIKEFEEKNRKLEEENRQAAQVLDTIVKDDELRTKFQEKYGPKPPKKEEKQENKELDAVKRDVEEIKVSSREQIIKGFEEKYGISKMDAEKAKEIRGKIRDYVSDFGTDLKDIPTEKLSSALERGFKAVDPESAKKAENSGYVKGYSNAVASFPTMSGGDIPDQDDKSLTDVQKKWAEKLGVDPKKAEEVIQNKDKERTTKSKAEIEAEKSK